MNRERRNEALERIKEAALSAFDGEVHSIVLKGSALTEDFVPGYSDLDVHIYVPPRFMLDDRAPLLELAIRFQREIGRLDPERYGVSSFQVFFVSTERYPEDWQKPLKGTYEVIYGAPIDDAPSMEDDLEKAHLHLGKHPAYVAYLIGKFADKLDSSLPQMVRLAGAFLKGAIYSASTVASENPKIITGMSFPELLNLLRDSGVDTSSAVAFIQVIREWNSLSRDPESCRGAFRLAMEALQSICRWYDSFNR
ncbi:MAG: hypothetical protein ACE5HJ_05465 [Thermoplasmata archaeon]